jgi:hypothetical protein
MINLALGRRQLGKTTLVYSMAMKCPYRVILDPRGMIHTPHGVRVTTSDQFFNVLDRMHADDGTREIVWTPRENLPTALDTASSEVIRWFEKFPQRRLMFVIDEARFFHNLETSQSLDYVLRASPQNTIDIAITAHRPKDIPTDIRAIGDYWLMFKHTQGHDLKVIEERCGVAVSDAVAALDRYQFIQWDDGAAVAKAYRNPSAWFVTLNDGRTPANAVPLLDSGENIELVDRNKLF